MSLQTFNENLVVEKYPVPPATSGLEQKNHPLAGDLAKFSLTCPPCDGPNILSFDRGSIVLHVVLNDGTVSLIETDVSQSVDSKPSQVHDSFICS